MVHLHYLKKLKTFWISHNLIWSMECRSFLGMVNFYHCFVLKAAAIMQIHFAKGKPKKVEWPQDMLTAFAAARHALAAATLLVHPHASAPTSITVDASNIAVGLEKLLSQW